jgi:nitrogen fixation-related uncharacterized protein
MDFVNYAAIALVGVMLVAFYWNHKDQQAFNKQMTDHIRGLAEDLVLLQFSIRMLASGRVPDTVTEEKVDE